MISGDLNLDQLTRDEGWLFREESTVMISPQNAKTKYKIRRKESPDGQDHTKSLGALNFKQLTFKRTECCVGSMAVFHWAGPGSN